MNALCCFTYIQSSEVSIVHASTYVMRVRRGHMTLESCVPTCLECALEGCLINVRLVHLLMEPFSDFSDPLVGEVAD